MRSMKLRALAQNRLGQSAVKGTELDMRLEVTIGVGTLILSLFTVIVPTFTIPDCVPHDMAYPPPAIRPFEPMVRPEPHSHWRYKIPVQAC